MDKRSTSLRDTITQLRSFVVFVAERFPMFHVSWALTLLVMGLEYASTSLMIPLSSSANGVITRAWTTLLSWFGIEPAQRTWLWLFLVAMIARLVFGYLQIVTTTILGKRVHQYLSGSIFSHVVNAEPLPAIYQRSVGHYITLAGDDTFRSGTIVATLMQTIVGAGTALVAMAVLYQFSPAMFGAIAGFLGLCALSIVLLLRHLLRTNLRANTLSRELGTTFVEALNSLRSIRALRGESFVTAAYAEQIARYVRMLGRMDAVRAGIKAFPAILLLTMAAVVLRPGASVGFSDATLLAGAVIVVRIFASLGLTVSSGATLLTDTRAVGDIESLLREASDVTRRPKDKAICPHVDSITLHDLEFSYRADTPLLGALNFRFEHGHAYAIVGPSGSGKSTLADILLGLLPPARGRVEINDGKLDVRTAHNRIMLVEQQPKIFSTTLRENILFGAKADDDHLWHILELVDLHAAVRQLPQGLDTPLSYLGENFSGGQRQRIGIARALIREPDVLLLDEATSALDPHTRTSVVAHLRTHMRGGIIIFITHDEVIAALADEILTIPSSDLDSRKAKAVA